MSFQLPSEEISTHQWNYILISLRRWPAQHICLGLEGPLSKMDWCKDDRLKIVDWVKHNPNRAIEVGAPCVVLAAMRGRFDEFCITRAFADLQYYWQMLVGSLTWWRDSVDDPQGTAEFLEENFLPED